MEKHLHIIDFTIPYPADYGGVIDLFWKLPALHAQGIFIHLHCFEYGRSKQIELQKYCTSVHYYQRNTGLKGVCINVPYIVYSRMNENLFTNLLKDDYPILMEGIHSTALMNDKRFEYRKKIIRLHNVEFAYYNDLAKISNNFIHKIYYLLESWLLKKYEKKLALSSALFLTVSPKDVTFYQHNFGCVNIQYLPLFIDEGWIIKEVDSFGNYCLYQADLSIEANEKVAIWLLKNVFSTLEIPFVIAGKNPSKKLTTLAHSMQHTCIVANPNNQEMQDMIAKSHINILPSFSNTGIKLKLINALYKGKHCIVNNASVSGTGLETLCYIANDAIKMKLLLEQLFHRPFNDNDIQNRKVVLNKIFNNQKNAIEFIKLVFN